MHFDERCGLFQCSKKNKSRLCSVLRVQAGLNHKIVLRKKGTKNTNKEVAFAFERIYYEGLFTYMKNIKLSMLYVIILYYLVYH